MPFESEAQRKYMYAAADRGDVPKKVVEEFSAATPKGKKLPEHKKEKSMSKAKEEATRSLNKLNEDLDDQFFKNTDCDSDKEEVEKGLKASVVNSLARRERLATAIAQYDDGSVDSYKAGIAQPQPAIGVSRASEGFEPPVVPVRAIGMSAHFVTTPVADVFKSCDSCGHMHKSIQACPHCEHLRNTAPSKWSR